MSNQTKSILKWLLAHIVFPATIFAAYFAVRIEGDFDAEQRVGVYFALAATWLCTEALIWTTPAADHARAALVQLCVVSLILLVSSIYSYELSFSRSPYIGWMFAYGVAIWLIVLPIQRWIRNSGKDDDPDLLYAKGEIKEITVIVTRLRRRAKRLRFASILTLCLIIFALFAGLQIFATAGTISARESIDSSYFVRSLLTDVRDLMVEMRRNASGFTPESTAKLSEALDRLSAGLSSTQPSAEEGTRALISTITTRVGAIMILLFLVQILVTLYRYNLRLAGYYDARADALQIFGSTGTTDFATIVTLFSPEALDFGKAPKTPADNVASLAKELATIAGRGAH